MPVSFVSQFDGFHEQAAKIVGEDDFGPTDYLAPMKLLLSDYDHCNFGSLGAEMAAGSVVSLLVARLFAQKGFKEHPEFSGESIKRPIIITGMARTGSTSLHRLLAKDPDTQWLTPWLGNTPIVRPPRASWDNNPWYQMTVQGFEAFYKLMPESAWMHPQSASDADECRLGMEPSFWSPAAAFFGAVHEYAKWVVDADATYAYSYYRKVLGLIAGDDKRRWILKDPTSHPWAPQTLVDTFPDACFVYTHRDPVTAMGSVSSMMYAARHVREPSLTSQQNGREQLALWGPAMAKTDRVLRSLDPARVCDIHIKELNADPVSTAERIYSYFKIPVSEEARRSWQQVAMTDPRGGHGSHHFDMESCGFTAADVYEGIGSYGDTYKKLYGDARR